jgi:hypothetical protein
LIFDDVDAVHGNPDGVTDERLLLILTWHCLHRPGIGAHAGDLPFRQPLRCGCTRASMAFVEFGVVLLPQLHMSGMEQHHIALPGLLDVLFGEGLFDVVHGDDVTDRQAFTALERQNIEQDAACEERFDVVDTELLEAVGPTDLVLRQTIVVACLVADQNTNVAETVELRSYLANFATEHLIVIHELLVPKRTTRRATGDGNGEMTLSEERNTGFEVHTQAVDLAGLDQLCRLQDFSRGDPLGRADLIICSPW